MDESDLCSRVVMGLHFADALGADVSGGFEYLLQLVVLGSLFWTSGFQSGALGRRHRLRILVSSREVSLYVFMIHLVYSQLK